MEKLFSSFNRWLLFCFAFIGAMIAVRRVYSGNGQFLFLVWNLFLAFIPYAISLLFTGPFFKNKKMQFLLFCTWLLFFPNALYIVTDIIHLEEAENVPVWYDAVLLFSSSFAGIAMAFASLVNTEFYLRQIFPRRLIGPAIITLFFIGSFGVYLGRFERWNSWDVIHHPLHLSSHIAADILFPFSHYRAWAVTFLLTGLYSVFWFLLKAFPRVNKEYST